MKKYSFYLLNEDFYGLFKGDNLKAFLELYFRKEESCYYEKQFEFFVKELNLEKIKDNTWYEDKENIYSVVVSQNCADKGLIEFKDGNVNNIEIDLLAIDIKECFDLLGEIIGTTYKEDSNLHLKVSKIPLGGLRGLIYYKLLT